MIKNVASARGLYALSALSLNIVLAAAGAQAADYYVSTTGSDSNPGTTAQPFRTITHAYSLASAGTTIHVLPGTYTDYQSGWGLRLGKSGSASSPIVLLSTVHGGAIIDGRNASDRNEAIYIDGSYNVVQGFEIKNGPNGGISIWGSGNQILDNEIDHNGNPASTSSNGRDGVYEDQSLSGNVFARNYIHDNGRAGGSNLDHGLYLCGNNDQVYNNVSIRNDGSGLQIAGYTTVSNMKVYNNVFAWNGTEGIIVWQAMNGVDIKNNICFQNKLYGIYFYAATGSGVVMDHNLIYGNGAGDYSSFSNGGSKVTYTLGTTISSDPLFVTEASAGFDAHLSTNSPAIGAGYNFNSLFTTDMAGTARPSNGAWDLGSYVFGAGVTNPITGGNSLHATISKDTDNAMRITWSSVVGKVYRVASKNSLSDSTWADLSGLLTATSTTTSYTDTTASRQPQRFYVVYVTN